MWNAFVGINSVLNAAITGIRHISANLSFKKEQDAQNGFAIFSR